MVIFLTRIGLVQSKILPYKMKQFHLCTWSSISLGFMTYVSNSFVCYQQLCANGGRCVFSDASSYSCICTPGWTGQSCRTNVNDCVQHWCQNGATCVDQIDGYRWVFQILIVSRSSKHQNVNDCKSCDIYYSLPSGLREFLKLYPVLRYSL